MSSSYWGVMMRRKPVWDSPTTIEIVPNFYLHTFYCSLFFLILMALVPIVLSRLYPTWYKSLTDKKKQELPAYLTSLVHHSTVVPLAWYGIYQDFQVTDPDQPFDMTVFINFAAPFCVGFIVADTFYYAIPLCFHGNVEYIIHHVLALWMTYALLSSSGHLVRYFPHIVICDTTNAVFNLAWILRTTGLRNSVFVSTLEVSFAVLFFFLRIINLSVVFYILFHSADGNFGVGKYAFPLISLLQFYWQLKIAQALLKKFAPSKEKGGHKDTTVSPRPAKKAA